MAPSHEYRKNLRYAVRVFQTPETEGLLRPSELVGNKLTMPTLEAWVALVLESDPRRLAPPGYRCRH